METIFLRSSLRRNRVQHAGNLLAWVYPLDDGADWRRGFALYLYYGRSAGGLRLSAKMRDRMPAADHSGIICGGGGEPAHGVACLGLFQPAWEPAGADLPTLQYILVFSLHAVGSLMRLAALRSAACSV